MWWLMLNMCCIIFISCYRLLWLWNGLYRWILMLGCWLSVIISVFLFCVFMLLSRMCMCMLCLVVW